MYVFMVKSTIKPEFKQQILNYYLNGHLDEVVATGCFESWTCEHDAHSNQLIVRYVCNSNEKFQEYLADFAPKFRADTQQIFPIEITHVERNFSQIIPPL